MRCTTEDEKKENEKNQNENGRQKKRRRKLKMTGKLHTMKIPIQKKYTLKKIKENCDIKNMTLR